MSRNGRRQERRIAIWGLTPLFRARSAAVRWLALGALLLAPCLSDGASAGTPGPAARSDAEHVGSRICATCHAQEWQLWQGSHHDHAMEEATDTAVLGDFSGVSFTAADVTTRFFRRDGHYFVHVQGPDGSLQDSPIRYTFGREPLQQYLIEFPGGRLQALGLAWDSRPAEAGGQRWFSLYPQARPGDPLHWSGRDQNWNYQCAECHSTGLRKGYDAGSDTFRTTWTEIDVACESCHGPGRAHVEQARARAQDGAAEWGADKGLTVDLADRDGGIWQQDAATGLPHRSVARSQQRELATCARCHARRGLLHEDDHPGEPLGQTHRLALLTEDLYFADGQIRDEVFVHGSFLQSRMYQQGVTWSDCHEPHSLQLRAPGDAVCGQCHPSTRYATPAHHHHPPASTGASCRACHMPERTYMGVDARADHSFRIPRPDLSRTLGVPNACSGCHADQPISWAEQKMHEWYGEGPFQRPQFATTLQAGRADPLRAAPALRALAAATEEPAIVRATAVDLLMPRGDAQTLSMLQDLLADPHDLVRAASARALGRALTPETARSLWPLLEDPVRLVRIDAARSLAPLMTLDPPAAVRESLAHGLEEYRAAQRATAERPESSLNLGLLESSLHRFDAAERSYQSALRLDPGFAPATVNLADLYRELRREDDAEETLCQGLTRSPENADLHHALGLLQIRRGHLEPAIAELEQAATLAPENPRYANVLALALEKAGETERAIQVLRTAIEHHPQEQDILATLVRIATLGGQQELAQEYGARLLQMRR